MTNSAALVKETNKTHKSYAKTELIIQNTDYKTADLHTRFDGIGIMGVSVKSPVISTMFE